jgi:putative hydrolase of the HAD superfamily
VKLRAVLFDVGNTLLTLDYPRLAREIGEALERQWTAEALARHGALAARDIESARTEADRAAAYFTAMFRRAGVADDELPRVRDLLRRLHAEAHLWSAVDPATRPALDRLRNAGLALGVVSNSDGRVAGALAAAGLIDCFDAVIDSALAGVEKPDPRIFLTALEALGVAPAEALYLGDLPDVDIDGARSAGLAAVMIVPRGIEAPAGVPVVNSVAELADRLIGAGAAPELEAWIQT